MKSNIYPAEGAVVGESFYVDDLHLTRMAGSLKRNDAEISYIVARPYHFLVEVNGKAHKILVPAGLKTDLASVPRCFRNIVGRVGRHLEASIVHDWLYVAWQVTGVMPQRHMWRFANDVMYSAMRKAGVSKPQIGVVKLGLECPPFSWRVFKAPEIGSPFADMSQQ